MLSKTKSRDSEKKEFDAVKLQRDIREKLAIEYNRDPKLRYKRLAAIRKKYGLTEKTKQNAIR